jgi:rhodanese-related sulfurtransferase
MRGEQLQIIDVRTRHEFANGHISGAVNVPIQSLVSRLPDLGLDASKPVVTICKTAHRSVPATRLLRRRGFHAAQLAHGLDEWHRQQLPLQSG